MLWHVTSSTITFMRRKSNRKLADGYRFEKLAMCGLSLQHDLVDIGSLLGKLRGMEMGSPYNRRVGQWKIRRAVIKI